MHVLCVLHVYVSVCMREGDTRAEVGSFDGLE